MVWVGAFSRNWAKLSDFTFCSEWTVFCWMQNFFGSRKNYSWKCTVCPYVTSPGHDIPWENKQLACFLFLLMSLHHNFSALLNRGYWLGVFLYVLHIWCISHYLVVFLEMKLSNCGKWKRRQRKLFSTDVLDDFSLKILKIQNRILLHYNYAFLFRAKF